MPTREIRTSVVTDGTRSELWELLTTVSGLTSCVAPGAEDGVRGEFTRTAGQIREDGLGHLLGELRGADLPECGRMNQAEVTADELGEGVVGLVPGIAIQQLQVGVAHDHWPIVARRRNPTDLPGDSTGTRLEFSEHREERHPPAFQ